MFLDIAIKIACAALLCMTFPKVNGILKDYEKWLYQLEKWFRTFKGKEKIFHLVNKWEQDSWIFPIHWMSSTNIVKWNKQHSHYMKGIFLPMISSIFLRVKLSGSFLSLQYLTAISSCVSLAWPFLHLLALTCFM